MSGMGHSGLWGSYSKRRRTARQSLQRTGTWCSSFTEAQDEDANVQSDEFEVAMTLGLLAGAAFAEDDLEEVFFCSLLGSPRCYDS